MIPVSKNEKYEVKITGISSDGNGVCRIGGFAVFVPDTCRGDVVNIRITRIKKGFAYGALTEMLRASESRAVPMCDVTRFCGGCALQHIDYEVQTEEKRFIVENAMSRIGGFKDFKLDKMIAADNPYRYRNKIVFHFGLNEAKEPVYGFFSPKSHKITPVSDCVLCDEIYMKLAEAVVGYAKDFNVSVCDENGRGGILKELLLRQSYETGEISAVIFVTSVNIRRKDELVKRIRAVSDKVSGIVLNAVSGKKNILSKTLVLYGSEKLTDSLLGLKFSISPQSFFQVNPAQTEKLYRTALDFADIKSGDTVMDIYCGIGTITLCAARYAKKAVGIEIVKEAIADAKKNASLNGINNAEFYAGAAADIVPSLISRGERPNVVILDPPRAGSDEKTLAAAVSALPDKIVYVSCNPATLARDIKYLAKNGYTLTKSAAVDMFPHTVHVESVVLMSRVKTERNIALTL